MSWGWPGEWQKGGKMGVMLLLHGLTASPGHGLSEVQASPHGSGRGPRDGSV